MRGVVAAGHPVTAGAGADTLRAGGNAVDAALETGGAVTLGWTVQDDWVEIQIHDEGPGLSSTANLFVPFFTTKPGGSGIGLVVSRQLAEAHGGTLTVENRPGGRGARAVLTLPGETS